MSGGLTSLMAVLEWFVEGRGCQTLGTVLESSFAEAGLFLDTIIVGTSVAKYYLLYVNIESFHALSSIPVYQYLKIFLKIFLKTLFLADIL